MPDDRANGAEHRGDDGAEEERRDRQMAEMLVTAAIGALLALVWFAVPVARCVVRR